MITMPPGENRTEWAIFFDWLAKVVGAAQDYGTTAQRPTKNLWIGRCYYDKTLNKPVYVNSTNPVVWKDAAGTTV